MRKSILVVDDEIDLRELMSELLEDEGYQCDVSASMSEAVQKISESIVKGSPFDLIITDNNMPGGSGFELLKAVREKNISTPFLFLSGEAIDSELAAYLNLGVIGYQLKPFRSIEFINKLKLIFES